MTARSLVRSLLVILGVSPHYSIAAEPLIEGYTWHNRLLLVFAPSVDDPRLRSQNEILANVESALLDRDLVVIRLLPDSPVVIDKLAVTGSKATTIYSDFDIDQQAFAVRLIGKDGSIKLSSATAVESKTLFDLIDSMPMRQWEMQNQASPNLQE